MGRESASGISVLAFHLARITISTLDVVSMSFLFSVGWYFFADPPNSFWLYYKVFRAAAFVGAGIGYLVSTFVPPQVATLCVSVAVLVMGASISEPTAISECVHKGWLAQIVPKISVFTWSSGWNYLRVVENSGGARVLCPLGCNKLYDGYSTLLGKESFATNAWLAIHVMWMILLIFSFTGLKYNNRDKQV